MLELSNRICGFSSLAIMKLDILSDMDDYVYLTKMKMGQELPLSSSFYLAKCEPVYKTSRLVSAEIDIQMEQYQLK